MANCLTKYIPNTLTCCNLVSGCIATMFALHADPKWALTWIIIGAAFDFFDGMSARILHVSSPIGKELDSLADDITFGIAPAAIVFAELRDMDYPSFLESTRAFLPYIAFIMAAFSALRLAKFNIDKRQATSFIGMPTPANALFWGSFVASQRAWFELVPWMSVLIIMLVFLCCWLMVCELPMFALKFKHWGLEGNKIKYSFTVFSILVIAVFGFTASFCLIIPCYVFVSAFVALHESNKKIDNRH